MRLSSDLSIEGPNGSTISISNEGDGKLVVACSDRADLSKLVGIYKRSFLKKRIGTWRPVNPLNQDVSIRVGEKRYLSWQARGKPKIGSWRMIWLYIWA
ncbi:MAG: hypothetical protein AAGF87_08325 [Bacteroidota bacterium]